MKTILPLLSSTLFLLLFAPQRVSAQFPESFKGSFPPTDWTACQGENDLACNRTGPLLAPHLTEARRLLCDMRTSPGVLPRLASDPAIYG